MHKFILCLFILFFAGCATVGEPIRTPNGLLVYQTEYPIDNNFIDWVFVKVIESTANRYIDVNSQTLLAAANGITIKFVPIPPMIMVNGQLKAARGIEDPNGDIKISIRGPNSYSWLDADEVYCAISHELIHYVAQQIDLNILGDNHGQAFYGKNSIDEEVCEEIKKVMYK